jgi:hypothetical protein
VVVPRFAPAAVTARLKAAARRSALKLTTTGELRLPDGVTAAEGCSGVVTIEVHRGRRLLSKRTVKLSRTCAYRATAILR